MAYLAHIGCMSTEATELSVSQARDRFSDVVNRAAFGGRSPTSPVAGGTSAPPRSCRPSSSSATRRWSTWRTAGSLRERLAALDAGRATAVPADEVARTLGL